MTDRTPPTARPVEAADLADRYDQMLRLADLFDSTGDDLRARARLAEEILGDDAVADSADLSPVTWRAVEEDLRAATTGKHGLLTRSVELDVDALMVRATVLTYRWIDELAEAAHRTLGAIAGRAIGYLAPEVELGGAIVAAGLIETDALDRDDVAGYLEELAAHNPDLLAHVDTGGGGLLEGLQMRALLTAGVLAGDARPGAARAGLRAAGVDPLAPDFGSALRDAAGGLVDAPPAPDVASRAPARTGAEAPRGLGGLLTELADCSGAVTVRQVAPHRWIGYLRGPGGAGGGRLRLVGGDQTAYAAAVVEALESAIGDDPDARVMLVGAGQAGVTAAEVAATVRSTAFSVDQVVTAGSPAAQVARVPGSTRVLSLEDRDDPVALFGSLVNAARTNRTTVVFEAGSAGADAYLAGARAADEAAHPELRAEIGRLREQGFLAG